MTDVYLALAKETDGQVRSGTHFICSAETGKVYPVISFGHLEYLQKFFSDYPVVGPVIKEKLVPFIHPDGRAPPDFLVHLTYFKLTQEDRARVLAAKEWYDRDPVACVKASLGIPKALDPLTWGIIGRRAEGMASLQLICHDIWYKPYPIGFGNFRDPPKVSGRPVDPDKSLLAGSTEKHAARLLVRHRFYGLN